MGCLILRGILRGILLHPQSRKPLLHKDLAILAILAGYIARVRVRARAQKNKFSATASTFLMTACVYFFDFSPRKYGKYGKNRMVERKNDLRHPRKNFPYPARKPS